MTKQTKTWKATERKVCRAWGGDRRGPDHSVSRSDGDDRVPVSIEVTRTTRPAYTWRVKWRQCTRNAGQDGKAPVLVIAEPRQRLDQMTAVVNHGWLLDVCRTAGIIE